MNMSKHLRSLLTQLHSGTLPLEIENGRYYGITREQRICKQYHLNVIALNILPIEQHYIQEANLDDANVTVKMKFLFSACKTILTLVKCIEVSLKHHV
mgnify:CR=1 FL=1